jgi:hypothetical protein
MDDQSFLTAFVKGFAGIAAIAAGAVPFCRVAWKSRTLTRPWLAKWCQLWPVSGLNRLFGEEEL